MTAEPADRVQAYTDTALLRRGVDPDNVEQAERAGPVGRLALATYRLPDGRYAVITAAQHRRSLMPWLFGQPLSLWVAVLGAAAAGLVLVGTRHELAPLRRLTDAVSRFDGRAPERVSAPRGAPEIRRLAQAVQGMQERIAGLMAERSLLIGAISHDLKTYLTRLRLRAEAVAQPALREKLVADLDAMTELIDASLGFARGTCRRGGPGAGGSRRPRRRRGGRARGPGRDHQPDRRGGAGRHGGRRRGRPAPRGGQPDRERRQVRTFLGGGGGEPDRDGLPDRRRG
ncbi:HAMP domain-containing protein [Methylobacterium oryzae CBMB20]